MAETRNQHKIVFLVDVNQKVIESYSEEKTSNYAKTVVLSAFRLLTHFGEITKSPSPSGIKKKSKQANLLWGFKYFNSRFHNIKLEKNVLKEFKTRHFDEFENEVERRFDEDLQKIFNIDSKKEIEINPKAYPSTFLGNSINELLYDFEWEAPDITSPVKHRRLKSNSAVLKPEDKRNNLIFLLRPCPKTPQQLRQFAGKRVLDADILIDACMKPKLLENFKGTFNLRLFWIDTDFVVEKFNNESLLLVEKAIESLRGSLIPANSLVRLGSPHLSNLCHFNLISKETKNTTDNKENKQEKNSDKKADHHLTTVLPFTSIINHYMKTNKDDENLESLRCSLVMPDGKRLCNIQLIQVEKPTRANEKQTQTLKVNMLFLSKSSLTCTDQSDRYTGSSSEKVTIEEDCALALSNKNGVIDLRLYGVLSARYLDILERKTDVDYLCTSLTLEDVITSVTFEKVLSHLLTNNCALVLKAPYTPSLLVLKPLTSSSGTLIMLCTGKTLVLERHLHRTEKAKTGDKPVKDVPSQEDTTKWSELIKRLTKDKCTAPKCHSQQKNDLVRGSCFDPSSTDKTHLPGCKPALVGLIDKLNERISQLDFLSEQEVTFLKKLQKTYRQENMPIRPRGSTPVDIPSETSTVFTETETKPSLTKQDSRKSRGSVQSRGEIIVARSRQTSQTKEEMKKCAEDNTFVSQSHKPSIDIQKDFSSESELQKYLEDQYNKVYDEDKHLFVCAQTIVTVCLHYMKDKGEENAEDSCEKLLQKEIIVSPARLREKYQNSSSDEETSRKIKEFQVQIVLRFECLSMLQTKENSVRGEDSRVDDIVTLLRTLSFTTEPKFLSDFMKNTLVDNYIHTLPETLTRMYDELMQPLPEVLELLMSPDKSADQSVFSQSLLSCDPDKSLDLSTDHISSTQPVSTKKDELLTKTQRNLRGRKLIHHPSLVDIGSKRQIVVQTKVSDSKENSKKIKQKSRKDLDKAFKHESKKFDRRKSVAVMETAKYSPGRKRKNLSVLKSPKSLMSPPFKSSKRRKVVAETPSHKQRSQSVWKRLEKERRRTHSVTSVKIVQESPMKKGEVKKDSPSQNKRALNLVRRSFYSAGPVSRTRSLTQSIQLADRIAGRERHRSGRLSSVLKEKPNSSLADFKSPDKNSSFLLSQLMGSPTPKKVKNTPHKSTPSKVIPDSPSLHTRSKSPGTMLSFPKILFEDSPKRPRGSSVRKSPHQSNSGMKTKQLSFSESLTPTKPPDLQADNYMSPSQNTRSKTLVTPTRHSVRAVLFGKSPESKPLKSKVHGPHVNVIGISPKGNLYNSETLKTDRKDAVTPKKKSTVVTLSTNISGSAKKKFRFRSPELLSAANQETSQTDTSNKVTTLSWQGDGGNAFSVSFSDNSVASNKPATSNKTPSPRKKMSAINDLQCNISSTPSPNKKSVIKTPTSLNMWPRKKRGRYDSNTSPKFTSLVSPGVEKKTRTRIEYDSKRQDNELEDSKLTQDLSQNSVKSCSFSLSSPSTRKRSLNLSPENVCMDFSPNKRRRVIQDEKGSEKLQLSYCLHSRLLSKRMSSMTSGMSGASEGFSTEFINSQGSIGAVSEQSLGSLSQASATSVDYFSSTNDEVFLSSTNNSDSAWNNSEKGLENTENKRTSSFSCASPTFGSAKKRRRLDKEMEQSDVSDTKLSSNSVHENNSSSSKVSPARKFSPSVTAKSLMHLINSPLLNSPGSGGRKQTSRNSPKIDQDSLNIRRQRMSGRSRRSLNLQK